MPSYRTLLRLLLMLAVGLVCTANAVAQVPAKRTPAGKIKVVGKYQQKQVKEGNATFAYHVLEQGNKFRLETEGPGALVLVTLRQDGKPVGFSLKLDDAKEAGIDAAPGAAPKSFFTEVPAGTHQLTLVPSDKILVRAVPVKRKAIKGERLITWKDTPVQSAMVPLVPIEKPKPVPPESLPVVPLVPPKVDTALAIAEVASETREIAGREAAQDRSKLIRISVSAGGVLPRAGLDFNAGYALGLDLEGHTITSSLPNGLMLHLEAGYALLKQQEPSMIPGRGSTNLIQNTHTIPAELGVRYCHRGPSWPIQPYGGAGLALDTALTTFKAFSTPAVEDRALSVGFVLTAGALAPLGPGGIFVEAKYREVWSDLGKLGKVGENTLSVFSFWLGYQFAI